MNSTILFMEQKDFPLVSVIMPAYNCEKFVVQAIESVLKQTYTNWELLIADDGSTDDTKGIIDQFEDDRIIRYHNKVNLGNIYTRNKLFREARGELLTVVDADDWIKEDKLQIQVKLLQEDNRLDGCVTSFYNVGVNGEPDHQEIYGSSFRLNTDYLLNKQSMVFHPASILIRREVYDLVGGLNSYFDRLYAEDKYWIYLIVEQFYILFVPNPLYFYRTNLHSLTNKIDDLRKLAITDLVKELMKQRATTGSDWLCAGDLQAARAYEQKLLNSNKWTSERYRIYGARYADMMAVKSALSFIKKSLVANPFNRKCWLTLLYCMRRYVQKLVM